VNHHFICYSSAEAGQFSARLATALSSGSPPFPVWLDQWGEIRPGYDWDDQLAEAIRSCASLIFVMTPDSVASNSVCKNEWTRALKYKKPVIPLLLDRAAELPFRLDPRERVDFTTSFDDGLARLRAHLEWLSSPTGLLTELNYRLADAQRDLRRATLQDRPRVETDIVELSRQITELQAVVDDAEGAANAVHQRISRGQENERRFAGGGPGSGKGRFINPPPASAPSYFQDRHVETGLISRFLTDESRRLLTIAGRGGIGKTAMVCRLLKSLERGEALDDAGRLSVDGVVYLSGSGSHRITVPNIFAGLTKLLRDDEAARIEGIYKDHRAGTEASVQSLAEAFPTGCVVLLLDNFEDVVDATTLNIRDPELCAALSALLASPQHAIKLILTTRIAARDLALVQPGRQTRFDLDAGLPEPFAENILREMDADGKLGLRDAGDDLLAKARERTCGYPRALEALFAILSADRDSSLSELLNSGESMPENVVRELVGEAFSRLDPAAQQVMQALAIYGRPVTPAAIDFLLQPYLLGLNSAVVLNRLVNMHFVRKEAGRYDLHPVDRAYALSRIPEGKESDGVANESKLTTLALFDRAADYFREVRLPFEKWKSIDDLAAYLAEFELRIAAEKYDQAAKALLEINSTCQTWGHYQLVIEKHESLRGRLSDPLLKLDSASTLGAAYSSVGAYDDAIRSFLQAVEIAGELHQERDGASMRQGMSWCYNELGQLGYAAEVEEQVLAVGRQLEDWDLAGGSLSNLGWYYGKLGQTSRAIDCCQSALEIYEQTGNRINTGIVLSNLAGLHIDEGHYEEAIERALESIEIGRQFNAPILLNWSGGFLASAYLFLDELALARSAAESAGEHDEPENNPNVFLLLGIIALKQKECGVAGAAFGTAVMHADAMLARSARNYNSLYSKALALCGLSLCGRRDHVLTALNAYQAAHSICGADGILRRVGRFLDVLAQEDPGAVLSPIIAFNPSANTPSAHHSDGA
jgi:tetratricopeptide (TPR) repeat protein